MLSNTASRQRVDLRRAVVSSAFAIAMLVVAVGLFSLFSVWSINRAWLEGTTDASRLQQLSNEATRAQVSFKVQVQEWKNILLRGDDLEQLQRYLSSFRERDQETRARLQSVATASEAMGLADRQAQTEALRSAHEAVSARYESVLADALKTGSSLSAETAREMDKSLRGIDRDLERDIGLLAGALSDLSNQRYSALVDKMDERYQILRRFIIGVVVLSLLITGYVLAGALRATKD